jgi:hypothetical protein
MYNIKRWTGMASILVVSFACSSKPAEIKGFEAYVWQQDKWGCGNERQKLITPLLESKEEILGLRETEVIRLLGKADEMELYTRNQKFLIYFLEPNPHCNTASVNEATNASALHIRLNAMGMAQEVFLKKR